MRRALLTVYRFRGMSLLGSALILLAIELTSNRELSNSLATVRGVVGLSALGVFAASILFVYFGHPLIEEQEVRVVAPPVRGRWLGLNSPASKVPSHGVRMYGQAYAIDLVAEPTDVVRPAYGNGAPAMRAVNEYPAFGEPVFSMVDGVVVRASDWRRDHRARSNWCGVMYMMIEGAVRELGGPSFVVGNHVTIRDANGRYALVAHLQQGSTTVRVGDTVQAGQQIARCGNSGNSSEPHVHAQLMDRVSPLTGQGSPIAFADITIDEDSTLIDGLPANGQHMFVTPLGDSSLGDSAQAE